MHYFIIGIAAFLTSLLTLFSGFGLGTLLMPVFAIFFPVKLAVGMTAIVHFFNNMFKLVLFGKHASKSIVFKFGIPAILGSLLGAFTLIHLSGLPPLLTFPFANHEAHVTLIKLVVAFLMIGFAVIELLPRFQSMSFNQKYISTGGLVSGFFGGISGHQGALRSAFLIRCNLPKASFIASGVVIACLVDLTRLSVYASHLAKGGISSNIQLIGCATLFAFLGIWTGNRFIEKVTMKSVQVVVSILLILIAMALGAGVI